MDKLKMAHDYAMKHGKSDTFGERANMIQHAWEYADAMQAEADKRVNKERPKVLFEPKCEMERPHGF